MKTAEKIMKGLECCCKGNHCAGHCPYDGPGGSIHGCTSELSGDALSLISQALQDIQMLGRMGANICILCEHYKHGEGSAACVACPKMDNFKWRGVQKEG